jgi:hypothetical protein
MDQEIPWQTVKGIKRKKRSPIADPTSREIPLENRFQVQTDTRNEVTNTGTEDPKVAKPHPIFLYGVTNLPEMRRINDLLDEGQYSIKSMANNNVKLFCQSPDTFRKLARYMRDKNIIHHTYQPKEERSYRVVIKYLHHSADVQELKTEISQQGHALRNIINAKHCVTKDPLNLLFVDLEPSNNNNNNNNKDIYNITRLQNSVIQIEPPRKGKHIVQCMRCQLYGHTKSYCNRPYACVKCGGQHSTASCKKSNTTPATCVLCGGDLPANYNGCAFYQKQNHAKYSNPRPHVAQPPPTDLPPQQSATPKSQNQTYAQALRGNGPIPAFTHAAEPMTLTTFLSEFKVML